jgi:hypothetical protein
MTAQNWNYLSLLEISEMEGKRRQPRRKLLGCLKTIASQFLIRRVAGRAGVGMPLGLESLLDQKLSIIQAFASEFAPRIAR